MAAIKLRGRELNHIAVLVITILGVVAFVATAWSGYLIHEAVVSENEIDSAAVALIGQMVSIATLTIGGLIAMLTSTGPKPPPPPQVLAGDGTPSTPVTVVNPPENPANVVDQAADELPVEDADTPDVDQGPPARRRR